MRAPTSDNLDRLVRDWMRAHPRARVVSVVDFGPMFTDKPKSGLKWVWVVDGTSHLNLELVRLGACVAGTMVAPPGSRVLVPSADYDAFVKRLPQLEQLAKNKRAGVWKDGGVAAGLNFRVVDQGEAVVFANGYQVTVPQNWEGKLDLGQALDVGKVAPAEAVLELNGPGLREVVVGLVAAGEARRDLSFWRGQVKADAVGQVAHGVFDGTKVDVAIVQETRGTPQRLLQIYLWTSPDPMWIQFSHREDIDVAVGKGASADQIVRMAFTEIGLRRSAN